MKNIAFFILLILSVNFLSADQSVIRNTSDVSPQDIIRAVETVKRDSLAAKTDFSEFIRDMEKIEGLFNLYRNRETGEVFLEIRPEQLEREYLCTVTRQSGDAYMFDASAQLWNFLFFFQRINKRIQLVEKNLKFRASEPAMQKAVQNSISNSIIASAKLSCQPDAETGALLIDASEIFLKDLMNVENSTGSRQRKFSFDKENSYFGDLRSFPINTEIEVILHFRNSDDFYIYTLPDSRSMLHRYHYSLLEIGGNDYRPRLADDRIGFFTTSYQDYTDLMTESPYVRYINRWHLKKQEPGKKLSKPVEPIVFWLENTIPERYRPAVKKGILAWNEAFEAIGFRDAIEVKEMPEQADWDPADARYNTIRWMIQPGSGYAVGPSHVNPYTGQIYDADVRISVDFLRHFFREYDELIEPKGWMEQLKSTESTGEREMDPRLEQVSQSEWMGQQLSWGYSVLVNRNLISSGRVNLDDFVDEGVTDLVMHEVGHTLGLRHNFKSSSVYTTEQLQDEAFTRKNGIVGSIMDYTPINLAPVAGRQGAFFQGRPGPWDKWVISYGYSEFGEQEEENLAAIASRCAEPLLDYGTDEDTYGLSSRGPDPLCSMFDMSSEPIRYYQDRIDIAREIWAEMLDKFEQDGNSYQKLLLVFAQGLSEYRTAAHNISKYIGGLYLHRDHIGDPDGRPPFEVVTAADQRAALLLLRDNILAQDAFYFPPELLNKLVYEKMEVFTNGYWDKERIDYPVHQAVSGIQAIVLDHLYDPLVLGRLLDNELRFSENEEKFTMLEMYGTVQDAVWSELFYNDSINSFRRELQRMYLYHMENMILNTNSALPNDAKALARYSLEKLNNMIMILDRDIMDRMTRIHLEDCSQKIIALLYAQQVIRQN